MTVGNSGKFRFGPYVFEYDSGRLHRDGREVVLNNFQVDLFRSLLDARGELVSKQSIKDAVWKGTNVEDNSVDKLVSKTRELMKDDGVVATVRSKGYKLGYQLADAGLPEQPRRRPRRRALVQAVLLIGLPIILVSAYLAYQKYRAYRPVLNLTSMDPGQTWYPTVVLPWVDYGGDFAGVRGWGTRGISGSQTIEGWFQTLERIGVRGVVWFLFADGRGLTFDAAGLVQPLAEEFIRAHKKATSLARRHQLQIIFVVLDFQVALPKEIENGVQKFGREELIRSAHHRESLLQNALLPLVKEAASERTTAAYILLNEPENLLRAGRVSQEDISTYITEAAQLVKLNAPRHPVAIGSKDLEGLLHFGNRLEVDFLVLHHYEPVLPPPVTLVWELLASKDRPRKPIFIGEFNLRQPPTGDIGQFVSWARLLGYAGAWPWSIRNKVDESRGKPADIELKSIQYEEAEQYVAGMRAAKDFSSQSDVKKRWIEHKVRLIKHFRERTLELARKEKDHEKGVRENQKWVADCRFYLEKAQHERPPVAGDFEKAKRSIEENKGYLADAEKAVGEYEQQLRDLRNALKANPSFPERRALDSSIAEVAAKLNDAIRERSKAQAALGKSETWYRKKASHLKEIEAEITKQGVKLPEAERMLRQHSYLGKETKASINRIWALLTKLEEEQAAWLEVGRR